MQYNFNNWNVDLIQEPNKLLKKLTEFNLKGKKIKSIRIVGYCYDISEQLDNTAYQKYGDEVAKIENFKDDYKFTRNIQFDNPIIIEFENGDKFEIDYSEGSSLKIGLNSLPDNIEPSCNYNNIDGNVIFSNLINQEIIGYEIGMQDDFELTYDFTGSYGIKEPKGQESYISFLKIILTNGLRIYFTNDYDYGYMAVKEWDKDTEIKWEELKQGIKE